MRPAASARSVPPLALLLALLFPPAPAAADAEAAPPPSAADPFRWGDQADRRALNGHFFLPSEVVRDPFVSTHFGTGTSFGYAKFRIQGFDANGDPVDLRLKLVAIQQAMELQVGVGHAGPVGFALRARASGDAVVGIDAESSLRAPIGVGYLYGAGFLVKGWGNRWFQLGVALDFARRTSYQVSPLAAIENSVQQGKLTSDGLLAKETVTDLVPSLSLAVSPYRVLGLVTALEYAWEHVDGGGSAQALDWGVHLGLDLGAVSVVPIGLQGVYQLQKALTGTKALVHYGGGGLFYTGRRNLALGAEAVVTRSSPGPGISQLLVLGQFRMRYLW